jgi:hypothetical protein
MYDELVTTARQHGNGDLLVGLFYMKVNRHEFDADTLRVFDQFMADGARMMAPVDSLED